MPGAAIELQDPARDVVEEVAIVRDRDDRARVLVQVVLEPGDALGVEVVGRLVEQQHVGPLEQHAAERHAAPLAARQLGDVGVGGRQPERVHRDLQRAVEIPAVGRLDRVLQLALLVEQLVHLAGLQVLAQLQVHLVEAGEQPLGRRHRHLDVAEHVLLRIQRRLLGQVADADAVGGLGVAEEVLVDAGHDAQQRRLAGAVRAEDADLGARVERQIDPLQDLLVRRVNPPEVLHRVDVLVRHGGGSVAAQPAGARAVASFTTAVVPAETERSPPRLSFQRTSRPGTVDVTRSNRTGGRAWSALSAQLGQARFF